MIRFCDKEVCCVSYDSLDREQLLRFFFDNHMDDIICVIDENGRYRGKIVYYSLIQCADIYSALQEDYVIWDENIWERAKYYFSQYKYGFGEHVLLPVVDKAGQLICFAYEDMDANAEMRMLRELTETAGALQFEDIYPEYRCVQIYGFNELAYSFAKYLESRNIAVQVYGNMWENFFAGTDCQILDYECMPIYAEGVREKTNNWIENLLRSVSVEFECIDLIYETNIKAGIIRDAMGDVDALIASLKKEKELIIIGAGLEAQDAYDYLMKNGIDICCFVNEELEEQSHRMFGKRILSSLEARKSYKNAVFLDCVSKNSAGGFGGVDYYDYIGYRRNRRFFLLRDYIEISGNSLISAIGTTRIVLTGDAYVCSRLFEYLKSNHISVTGYLDTVPSDEKKQCLPQISVSDISEDTMCLLVIPELFELESKKRQIREKERLIAYLKNNGIDNYTDYFSHLLSFIRIEESNGTKYTRKTLTPKRVVVGAIDHSCGNVFFKGLVDGHPNIVTDSENQLGAVLFWVCICLAMKPKEFILPLLLETFAGNEWFNSVAFEKKMKQLLENGDDFSSQELFVMIHIAYTYMHGIEIEDMQNMVIYWEPHDIPRFILEECVRWIGTDEVPCDILNMARNICMRNGSVLKLKIVQGYNQDRALVQYRYYMLDYPSIDKKSYEKSERQVLRFEDLKCNPQETLRELCNRWNIEWSDMLMKTTRNGKSVNYDNGIYSINDFDLRPVYNTYEEYFSEFDRFRIMLINAPWQRKYGYPYVEISSFSRRELQEMFLKEFRYEDRMEYNGPKSKLDSDIRLLNEIRIRLRKVKMLEILDSMGETDR